MTAARKQWAVRNNGFSNCPTIYDAARGEKFDIAHIYGQGNADSAEQDSHARLLASAPKLKAEAEKAVHGIEQLADMVNDYAAKLGLGRKVRAEDFTEGLHAAIAKAEGCTPSENPTQTFTAFCRQTDGAGTVWISSIEASDLEHAVQFAREACADAWGYPPEDVHVMGIAAGNVDILRWEDSPWD